MNNNYNRNFHGNYNRNGGKNNKKGDFPIVPIVVAVLLLTGMWSLLFPLLILYFVMKNIAGVDLVEKLSDFIQDNFIDTTRKDYTVHKRDEETTDPCGDGVYHGTFAGDQGEQTYSQQSTKTDPCGDSTYHGTFGEEYHSPAGQEYHDGKLSGSYSESKKQEQKAEKKAEKTRIKTEKKLRKDGKEDYCGNEGYHKTFAGVSRFAKKIPDGKLPLIIGAVITGIFAIGTVSEMIDLLPYQSLWNEDVIIPAIFTMGGIGTMVAGRKQAMKARQYRKLRNLIGENPSSISLRALAQAMPCSEAKVTKLVQEMIDADLLTAGAYIDSSNGILYLEGFGMEQKDTKDEPMNTAQAEEYQALNEIRRVNRMIPDLTMTRKIDRIEEITGQILDYQKKHPDKEAELRKFLNYYLPTTLKILNAYAELEEQGIHGENVDATKHRIEGMMDKVVEGFETQLDKLFAGDMMDIASDISVMEQMMNSDGLTSDIHMPKMDAVTEEKSAADAAFEGIHMTLEPEKKTAPAKPVMPTPPTAPDVPKTSSRSSADEMFRTINLTLDPNQDEESEEENLSGSYPSGGFGFGGGASAASVESDADEMFSSIHSSIDQDSESWKNGFYHRTKEELE